MSKPRITFWFEFASTYSYPAAMRIDALCEQSGVAVDWRPFLLGPIFADQGWLDSPFNIYPAKGAYMWRDLARVCDIYSLPFLKPPKFPQNGLMAARLATYGMPHGWGASFSKAVFDAQFGEGRAIDDEELLASLISSAGGDADSAFSGARSQPAKDQLRDTTEAAVELGIFGSPSFVTKGGELFWGEDRLAQAIEWAKSERSTY